ncbi:acyl-CoA dehydrogenase [Nocardioides sp. YIM 152315]|uniref:acyl-CoA dehydrogenase n=1 Tax=Nocardioides sp. YIM 152315 TaxID=3031760 RepID=UPI0023DAAFDE|nr:acyl-CoA dehydrogenase [Nocardioides sp. YIM 152315]MDF1604736.1 acyl-CoA dehydrogenase [Nocardioides sp. YIM 152315]
MSTSAGLATTEVQRDLAEVARRSTSWEQVVELGLHAVHLPEELGGGGGLAELAVVVEELGRSLAPVPLLPTVVASAVVAGSAAGSARSEALTAYADGATGVVVGGAGLLARSNGAGWRVDGLSAPTSGLPGADVVLVHAPTADGGEVWWHLRPGPTAVVQDRHAVDLTRSCGVLVLDGHVVEPDDVLTPPAPPTRDLLTNALHAAEAVGLGRWLLDTAVEHVRTRHQFGRPIGSFQAIHHKVALMLVRLETATAAAWDAARAAGSTPEQQALAAAQAALAGPPAAVDLAVECVSLLGAIGFTWEHDAHRYWRRALALATAVGPESTWARRLGELSRLHARDFALVPGDALPDLRAEIAPALDAAAGLAADEGVMTGWGPVRGGPRRAALAEARLVAPHYPAPWGRDAGPQEQAVIAQELARRGIPQPTTVIGEWVLPTLLEHGTDGQRERFVWPTLRGEIVWCQLFSEPGAGSDLAGLSTRARRVEGGWMLTGQKVWNSYAHEADWGVCLARTDPAAPRHAGISYFLVDMRGAGVDVRQIRQVTGQAEFNEVFLDDVFVPDDCVVGQPGDGWRLATTTLANERLNMGAALGHGGATLLRRAIDDGTCAATPEEALRVLGESTSREMALSALVLRGALARLDGQDPGPTVSVQKVWNAIAQRDGSRALVGVLGPQGAIDDPATPYALDHLGLPAVLFGGGTIEIQLNVIARRVLGLPGEPRKPAPTPVAKEPTRAP